MFSLDKKYYYLIRVRLVLCVQNNSSYPKYWRIVNVGFDSSKGLFKSLYKSIVFVKIVA